MIKGISPRSDFELSIEIRSVFIFKSLRGSTSSLGLTNEALLWISRLQKAAFFSVLIRDFCIAFSKPEHRQARVDLGKTS
jgi:hypothetical protein